MYLVYVLCVAIVAFIGVLLVRTAMFKPQASAAPAIVDVPVDAEKVTEHLAAMIRCKTVSSLDESLVDEAEFDKFRALLETLYPRVYEACKFERISKTGLLFSLKGKSDATPVVLMSHYDVVPAEEDAWDRPAFEGLVEDGVLWGRGTLDTKGTLCGVMEAAEALLSEGFTPENDMYFAFAGDEEIAGESAPEIVETLHQRGVKPAMVIDEGGAVVNGIFPGLSESCALIGIAEKGMLDLEFSLKSKGGHASAPPPHTPVGLLAAAAVRIENKPFHFELSKPVAEMYDTLGRHSTFLYRLIFSNLWCFKPLLDSMCRKSGGELNAMMRTTCALTMMEGSKATNVLPPVAKMRANLRLIGGDTVDSAISYLKTVVDNPDIEFKSLYGMNPSINSKTEGPFWDLLKNAISQTWPEAIVSPYLMMACSDSRHYCRISDGVYRFSAAFLSKEERATIHAHNERIPVESIVKTVQFYTRLMQMC